MFPHPTLPDSFHFAVHYLTLPYMTLPNYTLHFSYHIPPLPPYLIMSDIAAPYTSDTFPIRRTYFSMSCLAPCSTLSYLTLPYTLVYPHIILCWCALPSFTLVHHSIAYFTSPCLSLHIIVSHGLTYHTLFQNLPASHRPIYPTSSHAYFTVRPRPITDARSPDPTLFRILASMFMHAWIASPGANMDTSVTHICICIHTCVHICLHVHPCRMYIVPSGHNRHK